MFHCCWKKSFKKTKFQKRKQKTTVIRLLQDLHPDSVADKVKNSENCTLEAFFTCKMHKPDFPFRVIVSENNSWQSVVGNYLQKHLMSLRFDDLLRLRSWQEVTDHFKKGQGFTTCTTFGFSIDIEDLYCSIPHKELFNAVGIVIDESEEVPFHNKSGVNTDGPFSPF